MRKKHKAKTSKLRIALEISKLLFPPTKKRKPEVQAGFAFTFRRFTLLAHKSYFNSQLLPGHLKEFLENSNLSPSLPPHPEKHTVHKIWNPSTV